MPSPLNNRTRPAAVHSAQVPRNAPGAQTLPKKAWEPVVQGEPAGGHIRTALCIEPRDGAVRVPLADRSAEEVLALCRAEGIQVLRSRVVTASARIVPAFICALPEAISTSMVWISPEIRSDSACGVAL